MKYVRFDDLLWAASDNSVTKKNLLKLVFLPNQYLKGSAYKFLYSFDSIKDLIIKEQDDFIRQGEICLEHYDIEEIFTTFGECDELPLDVCVYGGELFIASDAGVHKSALNADNDYLIHPERLKKILDCPAVSLTAKAGMLAVSANEDGLFSHRLFIEDTPHIVDRPAYDGMSIKAEWSTAFTLINYSDLAHFSLLENDVEEQKNERLRELPRNYRKDISGKKFITKLGEKDVEMTSLMENTKIDFDDLIFTFNTQTSGFFFLKDGSLQVRNMLVKNNSYKYSSQSVHASELADTFVGQRPISAIAVPNGCMVETYDKVFLVKGNKTSQIADEPVYGIRSYLSSNNYRNLTTVVFDDHVEIIAFQHLPQASYKPDRTFRPGFLKENPSSSDDDSPEKDEWDDELPF